MLLCSRMASGRTSSLKVTQPGLGVLPGDLSPGFWLPSAPVGTRPSKQTLGMWWGPRSPRSGSQMPSPTQLIPCVDRSECRTQSSCPQMTSLQYFQTDTFMSAHCALLRPCVRVCASKTQTVNNKGRKATAEGAGAPSKWAAAGDTVREPRPARKHILQMISSHQAPELVRARIC